MERKEALRGHVEESDLDSDSEPEVYVQLDSDKSCNSDLEVDCEQDSALEQATAATINPSRGSSSDDDAWSAHSRSLSSGNDEHDDFSSDELLVITKTKKTSARSQSVIDSSSEDDVAPPAKRHCTKVPRSVVQWQNDHHWLGTEPADGKTRLFCTICRSHGKVARGGNITCAWIDGTFRHKLSGVNDHEGSKLHHDSVVTAQIAAGVAEKGGGSLPAMQVRASLQQHKTRDVAILKLIKGLYWIAKEDVALQKWQSLTMDLFEERHPACTCSLEQSLPTACHQLCQFGASSSHHQSVIDGSPSSEWRKLISNRDGGGEYHEQRSASTMS